MCLWAVFPLPATSLKVSFHDLPHLLSTPGTIYENKAKVPALTPTPSVDCDQKKDTKNSISRRKPDPSLSAIASRHLQPPELVELSTRFSKTHTRPIQDQRLVPREAIRRLRPVLRRSLASLCFNTKPTTPGAVPPASRRPWGGSSKPSSARCSSSASCCRYPLPSMSAAGTAGSRTAWRCSRTTSYTRPCGRSRRRRARGGRLAPRSGCRSGSSYPRC